MKFWISFTWIVLIHLFLQEKQKIKVKEKFDKCNKEKLLELCDVLDIPISKNTRRKVCEFSNAAC